MRLHPVEINHKPSDILWLMLMGHIFLQEGVGKKVTLDELSLNQMRSEVVGGKLISTKNLHVLISTLHIVENSDIQSIVCWLMSNMILDCQMDDEPSYIETFDGYTIDAGGRISVSFSDRVAGIIKPTTWTDFCLRNMFCCCPPNHQDAST